MSNPSESDRPDRPALSLAKATTQVDTERLLQLREEDRAVVEGLIESLQSALERVTQENVELERARSALDGERRRYQELFDLAPNAYLVTDEVGKILEANSSAGALFDVPRRFLPGKPLATFVDAGERRQFRMMLNDLRDETDERRCEFRVRPRSRLAIPVAAMVAPRRGADGSRNLIWILHDLTDQKRAEWETRALNAELEERVRERTAELEDTNRQLEEERERLDRLLGQMPAAVIVADASGEISLVNHETETLFQALGRRPRRYRDFELLKWNGEVCGLEERPLYRALERGEETSSERFGMRMADGSIRSLEWSAAPVRDASGSIVGAVATAVDVSDRERRERAEREFVANAAHQLRNPLAAIRSAVEVLQAGAKDNADTRDRFLAHIERDSARLTRLARSLLLLARAQSRLEEPRREIVQLQPLLYQLANRLQPPEGVSIEIECSAGLAAVANRELLEETLVCLGDNAVRYSGRGRVVFAGRSADGVLTLEVRDEGPGIPRAVQERMFDRFYRAGPSPGFGLGLAIAAQAAEATGAKLDIDSRPGSGTAARVTLPAAQMLTP